MASMVKTQCVACHHEIFHAEAHSSPYGQMCKGCYLRYLESIRPTYKNRAIAAIFIFLIPSILWYVIVIPEIPSTDFSKDGWVYFFFLLLIFGGIGGFSLAKNNYAHIGEAETREYYEGSYSDSDSYINLSKKSYKMYNEVQWMKIFFNIAIYGFWCLVAVFFGPIVFIKRWKDKKNLEDAIAKYTKELKPNEIRVTEKEVSAYTGLIAQKSLDQNAINYSLINGTKVKHIGYIFHNKTLYGAIESTQESTYFQENCVYFIELFKNSNQYKIVDIELQLYDTLFDLYIAQGDQNVQTNSSKLGFMTIHEAMSRIVDPNNQDNFTISNESGECIEFEQRAIIPKNEHLYAVIVPVDFSELGMDERDVIIIEIIKLKNGKYDMEVVTKKEIREWVGNKYYELLEKS